MTGKVRFVEDGATPVEAQDPLGGLSLDDYRQNEDDIIDQMIATAAARHSRRVILRVTRPDPADPGKSKLVVEFPIRSLTGEEFTECRRAVTEYSDGPVRLARETDGVRLVYAIVYAATVPDERGIKIWDHPRLRQRANAVSYEDVMRYLLEWGELTGPGGIIEAINDLSRLTAESTQVQIAGNS